MSRIGLAGTLTFFSLVFASSAFSATGRTPGKFHVSRTGAGTYTIPIWAPPGPKGIQPHIALTYNSQSGNGIVGVGWNVAGLSSIYRCNLTFAQDAAPAAVTLTTSDGLCLDGQRLRLTGGTYGVQGSTYQTEIANFEQITAYGTAGNGPAYFTVQLPNGQTYQYGFSASSQVLASGTSTASAWLLSEVSDPAGNTMAISYSQATGTAAPATISWTPESSGSSNYNYTMNFNYGATNVRPPYGYVAGTPITNPNLLSSIQIENFESTVKDYFLGYTQSGTTGRDELTSVTECANSESNCLSPTTINYQSGTAGVANPTTSTGSGTAVNGYVFAADINGDGLDDLIYATANGSNYDWWVQFATPSGFSAPVNTGAVTASGTKILIDRFLGTVVNQILASNGTTWYAYTWNGSSFTATSTGVSSTTTGFFIASADNFGNGLPSLLWISGTSLYILANTSSGGAISFASTATVGITNLLLSTYDLSLYGSNDIPQSSVKRMDFNGDGRQDLMMSYYVPGRGGGYYTYELISQGTSFVTGSVNPASGTYLPTNWNDDACTDLVGTTGAGTYISACNGNSGGTIATGVVGEVILDWNGDGRDDLLYVNGSTWYVAISTGNGYATGVSTGIPYTYVPLANWIALDTNGDGLTDWATVNASGNIVYGLHNGAGQPPDLVNEITDGYGNTVSPTYVSIAQSNYTPETYATYPYLNYIGPLYVVSEAIFSDPSNPPSGTYNQSYAYYGAAVNLQGRGFADFCCINMLDSRNALSYRAYYMQVFPYIGMEYKNFIVADVSTDVRANVGTPASTTLSGTSYQERYFPYMSNVTSYRWEVGGPENTDLVTTSSTNYTWDKYGNATNISTTLTDNDPDSPYVNDTWTTSTANTTDVDTTHWCLNLFTETQVEYTASINGSGNVTRTKSLTPDTTHCRYTQVVTAPSTSYQVTEAFGFDGFGNINSDSVTGVNMAARTTSLTWSNGTYTTGQFPLSVTDPSGATTNYAYNYTYGLVSSATDPNGEMTSWQYGDGFGRETQETRPDGTYTTYSYANCSSTGCPITGQSQGLYIQAQVYASGGALQYGSTDWRDSAERPLVLVTSMLANGSNARNEIRYDSLGRVISGAAPCLYSSPGTACMFWTTTAYDVLNRPVSVTRPVNSNGQTPTQTTDYTYAGRTTTITDPYSNTKTLIRDVNGWLRQTKDAYGYTVTLAYDQAGSKTEVTDSASATLWQSEAVTGYPSGYAYGIKPLLLKAMDADLGTWSYTYDALGELTGWWDAKNQGAQNPPFTMTYDALSRPLTRTEPDYFTQWTWGASASSHNVGTLQSVCTGVGSEPTSCTSSGYSEAESYDSLARLYQRAITIPSSGTYTYTSQYNSTTGLLNTFTYPVSTNGCQVTVQYGYTNGILASLTDASNATQCGSTGTVFWTADSTNPAGQVTEETLGNHIVTNRTYDAVTHWLSSVQSGVSGGSGVQNQAFLFDEMGDVTQRQDNNRGLTENIYYDDDYRLSSSTLGGTQNLSITYAANGNISSRSDVASGANWTYDSVHLHAVDEAGSSSYQYSYDANGNAVTRQGNSISWSSYNYPTSISAGSGSTAESVALAYGPGRQRWSQYYTGNSTTEQTYYVGDLMEVISSGGITAYRHYINAGSEAVGIYSRASTGNSIDYVLSDHQSSVASITNSSGGVIVPESFTPFGARRNPTTWSGAGSNTDLTTSAAITRQAYTFQTQLGLWMGMNHMNGRVQDDITGRFLGVSGILCVKA